MLENKDLDNTEREVVFACEMMAIEPAERGAHIENIQQLMARVRATKEVADGYRLELPLMEDLLVKAAQFIQLERLCCPFFSFSVELGSGATSFWLSLTGPAGVKPFIMAELGEFIPETILKN